MGKIKLEIIEESFSRKLSTSYELSILLGMDSFVYMVNDGQQRVLALKDFSFEAPADPVQNLVDQLILLTGEDKYLRLPHRNIRIGLSNHKTAILPDRLYNEAENKVYLKELTKVTPDQEVKSDRLAALDAHSVYAVDHSLIDVLRRYFPGARVFNLSTALLLGFHKYAVMNPAYQAYVHVRPGELFICLFKGGDLQFANSFSYQSARDFLYFIMLVYEQFELQAEETPLFISGRLVKDSEIYKLLHRYVLHLSFLQPPAFFQFGPKLNNQPGYFYFDLFCLMLCG